MKAVIPAAGMGTRFLPATKSIPKEMLPLLDKPAIQYVVEEARDAGCEDVLIVTGRHKRAIEDHFDRSPELEATLEVAGKTRFLDAVRSATVSEGLHYIRQDRPLGLGHAVLCAKWHVGREPFVLLLGDDVVVGEPSASRQLVEAGQRHGKSVVAVERVPRERLKAYGVPELGDEVEPGLFEARRFVEKPAPEDAPSDLGILGRYYLQPEVFDHLETTVEGAGGEIQLTDALDRLAAEGEVLVMEVQGRRLDLGSRVEWLKANLWQAWNDPRMGPEVQAFARDLVGS